MATLNLTGGNYNFATITAGDTYPAKVIRVEGYEAPLSRVRVSFRPCAGGDALLTLDSSNASITINDAATWDFTIEPINPVPLPAGNYAYQLETTDTAGDVRTLLQGTWQIIADLTT